MGMELKTLAFPALVLVLLTPATQGAGGPQPADTPALRRAHEVVDVINAQTRAEARSYVEKAVVPERREMLLGFLSGVQDMTRGVELHDTLNATPRAATVRLRSKLTGQWSNLEVLTGEQAPYWITGMTLGPDPGPSAPAGPKPETADIVREVDALVTTLSSADLFSGAVLLAKNGEILYAKAAGFANRDFAVPNRLDTKFNLGSMNKMFTSVAAAQLVEQGKLSFDDPLSKFLPDFPDPASARKIQIKHLLSHTSGLGSYFTPKFFDSSRARFRTVDEMMKELTTEETLQFEPGSKWRYSNTGMLVMGAVIEKVTGQSYFDYVREHIYKVAGMTNTDSYDLDLVNPNLAIGYDKEFTDAGPVFRNNLFVNVIRGGPAGGGYSTVEDLLKFDRALRENRLVGEPYVKLLLSPKPELSSETYGFGFIVDAKNHVAGHSGGFPGISANMEMFLDSGYTAIVLSNVGFGSVPVRQMLHDLLLAAQK